MTPSRLFEPNRCFIIAEVAQAHDGSLGLAHAFIDAAARIGADAVKFQTHIASAESTRAEPWRVRFSRQDETRFDYWKRTEFTPTAWEGLAGHASDLGLEFLSSPFSVEAADLLDRIGVAAWKIASGETTNAPLLRHLLQSGRPMLVSTGMSGLEEIDETVACIRARRVPFAVMQCTSMYPCPPEKVGLNALELFRHRYGSPVGLSDHSGSVFPGLAGAALGMDVFEAHITLSREMFGPDVAASLTTTEFAEVVRGIRYIERMRLNPVDKDAQAADLVQLKGMFGHSVVAAVNLDAGERLTRDKLAVKKPGTGIAPGELDNLIGRRVKHAIAADDMLAWEDLEE